MFLLNWSVQICQELSNWCAMFNMGYSFTLSTESFDTPLFIKQMRRESQTKMVVVYCPYLPPLRLWAVVQSGTTIHPGSMRGGRGGGALRYQMDIPTAKRLYSVEAVSARI